MKKINIDKLYNENDYTLQSLVKGVEGMEFIKYGDKWLIKNTPGIVVSDEEKLKLEKKELILKDIEGCECQKETTKKISKINKKLKEIKKDDPIEETNTTI